VLLGNGDGTFQPPRNFAVGRNPRSVVVGDFDRDGTPDIAVANDGTNNVSVLLGNGDGTFQPARNFAAGRNPYALAVGNFNGDGIADLVVANSGTTTVSVLLGNGDGTFRPARNFNVGPSPHAVAVGDFYADGNDDIAVGYSGGTRILRGNGDGTFQTTNVSYVTGSADSIAIGDFNRDRLPDLAVVSEGAGGVFILLNDGSGDGPARRSRRAAPSALISQRQITIAAIALSRAGNTPATSLRESRFAGTDSTTWLPDSSSSEDGDVTTFAVTLQTEGSPQRQVDSVDAPAPKLRLRPVLVSEMRYPEASDALASWCNSVAAVTAADKTDRISGWQADEEVI